MGRVQQQGSVTELKIPAQGPYVVVAKRTAAALAACAGFGLSDIDDLNIAVAHACQKAIAAGDRLWGAGRGTLKLIFRVVDGGLELEVRVLPGRAGQAAEGPTPREVALERQAEEMRRAAAVLSREVQTERQQRIMAQEEAQRLRAERGAVSEVAGLDETMSGRQIEDVAFNLIRLFVDDLRYQVDAHGNMRMRMVKYVVD